MLTNPDGLNHLTGAIIDAAITVHRETGPGLLEAVYTECLTYELQDRNFDVETNHRVPLVYRGRTLMNHDFLDLRVNGQVIIELKSVSALAPVHTSQLLAGDEAAIKPIAGVDHIAGNECRRPLENLRAHAMLEPRHHRRGHSSSELNPISTFRRLELRRQRLAR